MGVMVQIRDVPEALHEKLKARAEAGGVSLSEYLSKALGASTSNMAKSEAWDRIKARPRVKIGVRAADAISAGRDERDAHFDAVRSKRDRR